MRNGKRYRISETLLHSLAAAIEAGGGRVTVRKRGKDGTPIIIDVAIGGHSATVLPYVEKKESSPSENFLDVLYRRNQSEEAARGLELILLRQGAKVEPPFEEFAVPHFQE